MKYLVSTIFKYLGIIVLILALFHTINIISTVKQDNFDDFVMSNIIVIQSMLLWFFGIILLYFSIKIDLKIENQELIKSLLEETKLINKRQI